MDWTTIIGTSAAALCTFSNLPQLKKTWQSGSTKDLSLKAQLMLASGLGLCIVYGAIRADKVIVGANIAGLLMVGGIVWVKLRRRPTPAGRVP
jgi:MtN3 and saliva related transmembrane protein